MSMMVSALEMRSLQAQGLGGWRCRRVIDMRARQEGGGRVAGGGRQAARVPPRCPGGAAAHRYESPTTWRSCCFFSSISWCVRVSTCNTGEQTRDVGKSGGGGRTGVAAPGRASVAPADVPSQLDTTQRPSKRAAIERTSRISAIVRSRKSWPTSMVSDQPWRVAEGTRGGAKPCDGLPQT